MAGIAEGMKSDRAPRMTLIVQMVPALVVYATWIGVPEPDAPEVIRAYLDPGSASIVWQTIAGIVIASFVTIQAYWHRIKAAVLGRVGRGRVKNPDEHEERAQSDDVRDAGTPQARAK